MKLCSFGLLAKGIYVSGLTWLVSVLTLVCAGGGGDIRETLLISLTGIIVIGGGEGVLNRLTIGATLGLMDSRNCALNKGPESMASIFACCIINDFTIASNSYNSASSLI